MNISKTITKLFLTFPAITILFFANIATQAQTETTPKKRLNSPATVKGFVGGESHESYVIRVQKGQTLMVQISWVRKDDNKAEFTISRSANFFSAEPVKFGNWCECSKYVQFASL